MINICKLLYSIYNFTVLSFIGSINNVLFLDVNKINHLK